MTFYKHIKSKMIKTFVFFDIETTGLPYLEKNKTKIIELTLVAASRLDIENTLNGQPFTNKLSLLFNPQRIIQPASVKLTGLSNKDLINQPIFKNGIQSINSFLASLKKPVCLVAHNGNSFDYKILRAEYIDANEKLPEDLYCVDSLQGFRKILKEKNIYYGNLNKENNNISVEDYMTDDEDEEWPKLNASLEEWQEIDQLMTTLNIRPNPSGVNSKHNKNDTNKKKEKVSYSLSALYNRLLNKNINGAHRAEVDCLMLLECVVASKLYFLPWADDHCKLIYDIEPLKRYTF